MKSDPHLRKEPFLILLLVVFCTFLLGRNALAGSFMDKFVDPKDRKLDASDWLLKHKGFLPVPILVTEPAVGYGLGAALLFFHQSMDEKVAAMQTDDKGDKVDGKKKRLLPPSISGVIGAKTENDSWLLSGFHFGSWKKDHIRYTGALAKVSVNLTYYGKNEDSILKNGIDFNLNGWGLLQKLAFRLYDTDFFLGGKFAYFDSTCKFDLDRVPVDTEEWELKIKNVGMGFTLEYDSRDNLFTPSHGLNTDISAMFVTAENADDGTREYVIVDANNRWYWEMFSEFNMGWRIGGSFSSGDIPFYALPFIDLRGIPVLRYQGNNVLQTELEAMYEFTERWTAGPFAGVGITAEEFNEFGSGEPKFAGGFGFRYLIARKLRMSYGMDLAYSQEGWAIYFQVGSGL